MTRRTRLSLLYAGTGSGRWFRAAVSNPDADLLAQCVWQWKNASAARGAGAGPPALRLPVLPPTGEFEASGRKTRCK